MGLNSKSEKRGAEVSLLEEGENDERPSKRLKPFDGKGGLSAIIADEYKTSSGPPSPVPFLSQDGRVTKPAEIFRTDLISAMKLPDTQILNPENYMTIVDPWRQEWERGVQVPVHPECLSQPSFTVVDAPKKSTSFKLVGKLLNSDEKRKGKSPCNYDLDRIDVEWLASVNKARQNKGQADLEESVLEKAISYLEDKCYENLGYAIVTQEGLSIEYDESVCCDVCQSPDSEEGNEMVFCDSCDICVHQACYGIQTIPSGSWLCCPCTRAVSKPPCKLCPNSGGAMKRTKKGKNWIHVSCALWVPEVGFGSVERMEPIIKLESIPASRWNLVCYICREKVGACIQCTVKTCMTAFHVTCGFKEGLEMKTILDDTAVDGVRHLCYCAKHGYKNKSPPRTPEKIRQDAEDAENLRQKRLKQMETEFYKYVEVAEFAKDLNIPKDTAMRIHAFWTLKRKDRDDIPLLPPTLEQQEKLCGKQGTASKTLQIQIEELMKMRCDLERLRNLCYMVSKREKLRRELYRAREQVFWKAHEVMIDESIDIDGNDLQWIRQACGKNFSSDGAQPSVPPSFENPSEPVCSPSTTTCESEKTSTDEIRVEQSQETSECSEDDVKGGYESSDSEGSPRIKTRRRLRVLGSRRSVNEVGVSCLPSDNNDSQHGKGVSKTNEPQDENSTEHKQDTKTEEQTPRRSLRFHKTSMSSDDTDDNTTLETSTHRPLESEVDTGDNSIGLHRPRTRGQTTSEGTSDEMELESIRLEDLPPVSPNRTLRSGTVMSPPKKAKTRSKSIGDIDTPPRETRRTRSSLSQSDGEVVARNSTTDVLSTTSSVDLPRSRLPDTEVSKEEKVLKEKNIRTRAGRTRTSSQSGQSDNGDIIIPTKRSRLELKKQSKTRRVSKEESNNSQARITQFFFKNSPRQKRSTKSPKAKFLNGYKSPQSRKSTESESSKSDEENTEHRVERLSSLRSFNPSNNTVLQSPCPKCQIQHNQTRSASTSPEKKYKELKTRNMQSPRSRSRLLSSLRCSPSRSCSNTLSQVASVV